MKVIIVSSSIRSGRKTHNVAVELEKRLIAANHKVSLLDLLPLKIPPMELLFSEHIDPPEGLSTLKDELTSADAMIFVSPEYNGSYSPALKNAIDYLPKSTYQKKVIGVASVSDGALGGIRAALQLQQLVMALFAYPVPRMLTVSNVGDIFDEENKLTDESFPKKVDNFIKEFIWLAEAVYEKKRNS
jgi:NAD(P)H-dependent FMN reductase